MEAIVEQNLNIAAIFAEEGSRLRSFIRRRVPNEADAEELAQEVFFELVEAHRLLKPIDYVTAWMYRVARNRITDLFRKKKPENFSDWAVEDEEGALQAFEDLIPSPEAGPELQFLRRRLLDALEQAIAELPAKQRAVFIAHEFEGLSFQELAEETGAPINTLLARKRYAVKRLRHRLETIHQEFSTK